MQLTCPACGGELEFKSRFSTMSICPYCQSILKRNGEMWQQQGKMAVLPSDMSPFQIGTQGKYFGKSFEMIGQLKVAWQDGSWNEWYLIEPNGDAAWLAEAMGFLSYSQEIILNETLNEPTFLNAGQAITIENMSYTISDIKEFECVGCVGELPFEFTTGMKGISIDLLTTDNNCAYLEYTHGKYRFFKGKNVSFEDLQLTNLRALDGW
ncbi:DUF4178 domain-containing protein [Candidatus Berkiella aquae]|uniref:DUF4178 domain-containing protein n=1 Tax=Candidatus Berkiella aquae TaxID=295108 RepID=A0A0Q9YRQ8_9GAMM|nr:DUF4178 domain-containing protein [Candidatus Berkiella aquae]MCS5709953.1 DUF4178 domain-containing protein [Candidatus Berkiella aquae]